jgi:limonene 1,2-monooxygenase
VIPEVNGLVANLRDSQAFVASSRGIFEQAGQAVMAKIRQNPDAAAAHAQGSKG